MKTKEICQLHAIRRAWQRYKFHLTIDQISNLSNFIKKPEIEKYSGKSRFVIQKTRRISIYEVFFNSLWIPVAYDRERRTIVSFLPQDYKKGEPFGNDKEEQKD